MKYRLYRFIDKMTLEFVYESNDLEFLRNMKKALIMKYRVNYLLVEVL